ncbi:MAG: PIG-L deacetylase family protein [Candidatus Micrarchaeota archaeon]
MHVLVIGAHPDDEVYGCGGTIARMASEGHEIYVLIVTEGSSAQYKDKKMIDVKRQEAEKVKELLKIKKYIFGEFADMKLDSVPHLELNKFIEAAIDEIKPEYIFTHYKHDLNKDHQKIFESTMVAARPGRKFIKRIYSYEVPSTTELGSVAFQPNKFFNITSYIDKKKKAVEIYKSELREYPHARNAEAVEALAKYRGYSSNLKYAEAFMLIRAIE